VYSGKATIPERTKVLNFKEGGRCDKACIRLGDFKPRRNPSEELPDSEKKLARAADVLIGEFKRPLARRTGT